MRTIKFESDELSEVLSVFGKLVPKKAVNPIYECVLLCPMSGREVELRCSDFVDNALSVTLHMENDLDKVYGIAYDTLLSICANNPKTYVDLVIDEESKKINAKTINGEIIASMYGEVEDEYIFTPTISEGEDVTEIEINGYALITALNDVAFARATDKAREIMTHTYLGCLEDGSINVVATDGRVLAIKNVPARISTASIIMTEKAAKVISAICARQLLIRKLNDTCAIAHADGYTFAFAIPDGRYPNYNAVYPDTTTYKSFVCNSLTLANALKRAKDFGNKGSNLANLTFTTNSINVRSTDHDYGTQISEVIPCRGDETEQLKIGASFLFFSRILSNISGANVRVLVRASNMPLIIQGADTNQRFLLMPMALDDTELNFGEIKPEDEVDEEIEETEDEVEDETEV